MGVGIKTRQGQTGRPGGQKQSKHLKGIEMLLGPVWCSGVQLL